MPDPRSTCRTRYSGFNWTGRCSVDSIQEAIHQSLTPLVTRRPRLLGVVPAQHAQRSQRGPAAWFAVALLHLEMNQPRVGVFQEPGAIRLLLVPDDLDGLG
jgi:hypothetical protein